MPCSSDASQATMRSCGSPGSVSPRRAWPPRCTPTRQVELEHVLRFVPPHPRLPVVHLNRSTNLLHEQSRALVAEFAGRFAGRIAGLVVHDKREMGDRRQTAC